MKSLYTTIIALVWALTATAQHQVPVTENFESTVKVSTTGGWQSLNSTEKGNFIQTGTPTNPGNSTTYTVDMTIKTTDFKSINVAWQELNVQGTNGNNSVYTRTLAFSVDGTTFTTLDPGAVSGTDWAAKSLTLGTAADNKASVILRWTMSKVNGSTSQFGFDDINVTGTFITPIPAGALPVELASFQGQAAKGAAKLSWTTATEINNDKFVVERSQNGKDFSKVAEVKGNGNSSVKLSYTYTDNAPVNGLNYYRLRQLDTDGTESFSNVVALEVAGNMSATVYPTVATSAVTISLEQITGNVVISVVDANGKPVATFNNTAERIFEVPVQNLKSGIYFVRISNGQNQQVQRFIKN